MEKKAELLPLKGQGVEQGQGELYKQSFSLILLPLPIRPFLYR